MDLSVIPECFVDTMLIETLVAPTQKYNHQKGCGTVTKVMKDRFANDFALGIVDKDKKELEYLKEFDILYSNNNLELLKHNTKNHFIIRIAPAMEKFILSNVERAELNIADFDLPSDFEAFKKETKTTNSKSDVRFKRLFRALSQKNLPDFNHLRIWIQHLKAHPYDADIGFLKSV